MRVVFVIRNDADRNLGGDTIQMLKTKTALEALGVRVQIRNPDQLENLPDFDLAHVFNIQTAEASWKAYAALKRQRLPIVLSPIYWEVLEYWFETAIVQRRLWAWLARGLGRGLARRAYVNWQQRKAPLTSQWRLQRRLLREAQHVLPNAASEARLLQKTYRLGASFQSRMHVVPNGIDATLYNTPPTSSQEFVHTYGVRDFVLEVGTISPTKNQLGLIEALYDLPVPLVFIGQTVDIMPEYGARCRARAAERGNTVFVDRLSHEQLPGIYALAAVHALPSWRETPGLASLEAAAAGSRVVTTSIGSTYDYFGDLAWYCRPDDGHSIRAAVEAALSTPHSQALRERVLANYTWEHAAQATLSAYQRVLTGSGAVRWISDPSIA